MTKVLLSDTKTIDVFQYMLDRVGIFDAIGTVIL